MYSYDKPDNLIELVEESIARNAERPLFGTPDSRGSYTWTTYAEVGARIDSLRAGLARLGVGEGDAVGVIAGNRVEWAVAAFASFGLGARFIPMYEKELPKIWRHIIHDGGIKVLFVANENIFLEVQRFRRELSCLRHIFLIDGRSVTNMADIEADGRQNPVRSLRPKAEDVAVLIYTSGTTGNPKGVLLSHGNFTSNVIAGGNRFPEIGCNSRSISILPWAHSYGQTAELYNFIHRGASIGFMRSMATLTEDMARLAPTFLIAVPRVFNKIHDGLRAKFNESGGLVQRLFTMGLANAAEIRTRNALGGNTLWPRLKYGLANRIVFNKIRKRFGGRLDSALTASALMNMQVAQFFTDIGLTVFDAYGLTETSPAVTMNCRIANKPGSVGRPIDKVRVVIEKSENGNAPDEGEIIVYGPNVMQGYHNNPEATREVMTTDGGLRTGDLGRLDEEGFLFVTGRIKEQYKLENGKYVFPASIEEEIQLSPWVENALIYGEGHGYNICLVVPDFARVTAWARAQGIDGHPRELIGNVQVKSMIARVILAHLKHKFGGYEIPKDFILVDEPFSVENGLLTQTLKLKRRKVIERYRERIDAVYERGPKAG